MEYPAYVPPINEAHLASYTVPNAACPVCKEAVFFYQSPHGGRVFFDELGPPWPKHPCTDPQSIPAPFSKHIPSSFRQSSNEEWKPFLWLSAASFSNNILQLSGKMDGETYTLFTSKTDFKSESFIPLEVIASRVTCRKGTGIFRISAFLAEKYDLIEFDAWDSYFKNKNRSAGLIVKRNPFGLKAPPIVAPATESDLDRQISKIRNISGKRIKPKKVDLLCAELVVMRRSFRDESLRKRADREIARLRMFRNAMRTKEESARVANSLFFQYDEQIKTKGNVTKDLKTDLNLLTKLFPDTLFAHKAKELLENLL